MDLTDKIKIHYLEKDSIGYWINPVKYGLLFSVIQSKDQNWAIAVSIKDFRVVHPFTFGVSAGYPAPSPLWRITKYNIPHIKSCYPDSLYLNNRKITLEQFNYLHKYCKCLLLLCTLKNPLPSLWYCHFKNLKENIIPLFH